VLRKAYKTEEKENGYNRSKQTIISETEIKFLYLCPIKERQANSIAGFWMNNKQIQSYD